MPGDLAHGRDSPPGELPSTYVHYPGPGRPCIHLLNEQPPARMFFNADALTRLNWQPRFCGNIFASRVGDIVLIAVDVLGGGGPRGHNHNGYGDYSAHYPKGGGLNPAHVFRYQLANESYSGIICGDLIADDTQRPG